MKKAVCLLITLITIFSAFAFAFNANAANEKEKVTLNLQINQPVAGRKADSTIKIDDEKFVPGNSGLILFSVSDPGYCSENFGKFPSIDEVMVPELWIGGLAGTKEEKLCKAYFSSITQMVKNGIAWIEYDKNDIQTLIDADLVSERALEEYKEYRNAPITGYLLEISREYGLSIIGKDGKEYSTSARCMEPGEKFKEGKSYICMCAASADITADIEELSKAVNDYIPFSKKANAITEKLRTATEAEAEELNAQLEALRDEYKKEESAYLVKSKEISEKIHEITGGDGVCPDITVNGEKTIYEPEGFYASFYDFGEAEESPSFIEQIIAFFRSIIETITNLFPFIR